MSTTPNMLNVGSSIYLWGSKHPVDVWIFTKEKTSPFTSCRKKNPIVHRSAALHCLCHVSCSWEVGIVTNTIQIIEMVNLL